MTNEELKKKIIEVIDCLWIDYPPESDEVADALIAAGIGDVKEVEHRAEVAERALKIAEELGELCAPRQYYIDEAKKELAEEIK